MIINNRHIKKGLEWTGKCLHSPEQRLILGATALATQPFIDLHNNNVDKETRKVSVARTIAKIIAGTLVGVVIRQIGISVVQKNSKYLTKMVEGSSEMVERVFPEKGRGFFVPAFDKILKIGDAPMFPIHKDVLAKRFDKYTKAMGTFVATVAMVGTNFLIDAPLTKVLTNFFIKKINNVCQPKDTEGKK